MSTTTLKPVSEMTNAAVDQEIAERQGWRFDPDKARDLGPGLYCQWFMPDGRSSVTYRAPSTCEISAWRLLQWLVGRGYIVAFRPDLNLTTIYPHVQEGADAPALARAALLALRATEVEK